MIKPIQEIRVRLCNDTGGRTLVVDTASKRAQRHAWDCRKKFSSWIDAAFEHNKQQIIDVSPCYDMSEVVAYIKNVQPAQELSVMQYKPGCFQIDCASERASKWASECQRKFDVLPWGYPRTPRSYYTIHIAPRFSAEEVEAYIKNAPWLRELRAVKHGAGILVYAESERASQWALECQRKFGTFVNEVNMKDFFINASPLWNTDAVLEYINNPAWSVELTIKRCPNQRAIWVTIHTKQAEMWLLERSGWYGHYLNVMPDAVYPKETCIVVSKHYNFETIFAVIESQPWCKAI